MRLVLDTNVVLSALLWNGLPRRLLEAGYGEDISFVSSPPMLAELKDVLKRSKFQPQVAESTFSAEELLERYAVLVTSVSPEPISRTAPDPDDDVVIGTALAAKAELLVTGDKGLLSVRRYSAGRIVTVVEAIRETRVFPQTAPR